MLVLTTIHHHEQILTFLHQYQSELIKLQILVRSAWYIMKIIITLIAKITNDLHVVDIDETNNKFK